MEQLNDLFKKHGIPQDKQLLVAFLLASYQLLKCKKSNETIEEENLLSYEFDELYVSEYDLICGAYHNGKWFSFENIIEAIANYCTTYDDK